MKKDEVTYIGKQYADLASESAAKNRCSENNYAAREMASSASKAGRPAYNELKDQEAGCRVLQSFRTTLSNRIWQYICGTIIGTFYRRNTHFFAAGSRFERVMLNGRENFWV